MKFNGSLEEEEEGGTDNQKVEEGGVRKMRLSVGMRQNGKVMVNVTKCIARMYEMLA